MSISTQDIENIVKKIVSEMTEAPETQKSGYEIPVGIIMAFMGAPFFVFILVKGKGGYPHA